MKKTAIALLVGLAVLGLSGCGGGGGSSGATDTSAMIIALNPATTLMMSSNSTVNVDMTTSVRSTTTPPNTISSMSWTLTQVTGAAPGTTGGVLTLSNGTCANININGVNGECATLVSVPSNAGNGQWTLTGEAKSSDGQIRTQSVTINVDTTNFVVGAGINQSVTAQGGTYASVNLNGVVSGAVSSDAMTYSWKQTSGPVVSVLSSNSLNASFVPVSQGAYVFELTVKDTVTGVTQTALTTVVANDNVGFSLNAGNSQSVVAQSGAYSTVILPATVTNVGQSDVISFQWTQTGGPSITLANSNSATASFVPAGPGTYIFQVVANDISLNASQTAVTTVVAN